MTGCERVRSALHLYIDSELTATEELEIEAHLLDCDSCRNEYAGIRSVVDTVRGSKPLYAPPPVLQASVEAMVRTAGQKNRSWTLRAGMPAAMATAVLVLLLGLPFFTRSESFQVYAAEAHMRHVGGRLPLDITSDQPAEVSSWLQKRLPFYLSVPNYPTDSEEAKAYTLAGARLMQYGDEDVAYLAYEMKSRLVSLLVSSGNGIQPAGGEVVRSGNLLFHFSTQKGLNVITWRDRNLVYALVSDVQVGDAQSCVVCHGSPDERSRFENMSPSPD